MPTPTYIPLATVTLGSSASSVTFSSIPATFRDLILVTDGTGSARDFFLRFNGDASNYSRVGMFAQPASAASFSETSSLALVFEPFRSNNITQIMDYSATDKHKTYLSRMNRGSNVVLASAHRYASTSAITSLAVIGDAGATMLTGTTLSLYGIAS